MILCYVLSSGFDTQKVAQTLIATPIAVFIIITVMYAMIRSPSCHKLESFNCLKSNTTTESTQNSTANTPLSAQSLIQPTSTVASYGIKDTDMKIQLHIIVLHECLKKYSQ